MATDPFAAARNTWGTKEQRHAKREGKECM